MTFVNILLVFITGMIISFNAQARSADESMYLLKEALMESNGDYNKHKKKFNHEEFDRADTWTDRGTQAIMIDGQNRTASMQEFKELANDFRPNNREVSSNESENQENKLAD